METKPLADFYRDARRASGSRSRCKICEGEITRATRATPGGRARHAASQAAWQRANPERYSAQSRAWYHRNRDAAIAAVRAWTAAHPECGRLARKRRRARTHGADTDWSAASQLVSHWEAQGLTTCVYCPNGPFEHVDHVMPLARGGSHLLRNLVPACADCNRRKGASVDITWRLRARAAGWRGDAQDIDAAPAPVDAVNVSRL